jgi:hypothetical protein
VIVRNCTLNTGCIAIRFGGNLFCHKLQTAPYL